jgi:hypothetical protein
MLNTQLHCILTKCHTFISKLKHELSNQAAEYFIDTQNTNPIFILWIH